jgi:hypothetical protein
MHLETTSILFKLMNQSIYLSNLLNVILHIQVNAYFKFQADLASILPMQLDYLRSLWNAEIYKVCILCMCVHMCETAC